MKKKPKTKRLYFLFCDYPGSRHDSWVNELKILKWCKEYQFRRRSVCLSFLSHPVGADYFQAEFGITNLRTTVPYQNQHNTKDFLDFTWARNGMSGQTHICLIFHMVKKKLCLHQNPPIPGWKQRKRLLKIILGVRIFQDDPKFWHADNKTLSFYR